MHKLKGETSYNRRYDIHNFYRKKGLQIQTLALPLGLALARTVCWLFLNRCNKTAKFVDFGEIFSLLHTQLNR